MLGCMEDSGDLGRVEDSSTIEDGCDAGCVEDSDGVGV